MVALFAATVRLAGDTDSTPFAGVRYVHRHVTEPRQIDIHIALADLNRSGVKS
jgi:hypothetical protein